MDHILQGSNQDLNGDLEKIYSIYDGLNDFKTDNLDNDSIGRSFYQLGKLFYDKSDLIQAEENFKKCLKYAERPRDNFHVLKVLGFLIRISSEKLETEKASEYITFANQLVEELASSLGTLSSEYFYHVGLVKNYAGNFDEAKANFLLAHKKSKEENEPELLAKCLLALSMNSYNFQKFDESIDYLDQLSQLLKIITKNYLLGAMYHFYAKVFLEMGRFGEAIDAFSNANRTLNDKKCWNLFGYILLGKGIAFKRSGKYDLSLEYFNLALETVDTKVFKRLSNLVSAEIEDVNDSSIDLYLDRTNRKVKERTMGVIDFKHRFVLLEILFLLARNRGRFFDKEQLAKHIWKDEYNPLIHDKLIYTSVSRLRKLIEPKNDKSEKRKYIIRGKDGYTFNPLSNIRFHHEGREEAKTTIGNIELSSPV